MKRSYLIAFALIVGLGYFVFETPPGDFVQWYVFPDRPKAGYVKRRIPNLGHELRVDIDKHGIPLIQGENNRDVWRGLGYLHGRDRRFQMEVFRYAARGSLRELFPIGENGDPVINKIDRTNRILNLQQDADYMINNLSDSELGLIQAYADGVNAATRLEPRPFEFKLINHYPDDWQVQDSLMLLSMLSYNLAKNWQMELGRLEMVVHRLRDKDDPMEALDIWKTSMPMGPFIVSNADIIYGNPPVDPPAVIPEAIEFLKGLPLRPLNEDGTIAKAEAMEHGATELDAMVALSAEMLEFNWNGSNNWAVSGQHTASGGALVVGDPHLKYGMPALFYLAGVTCPDYKASGASFPGIPVITMGTNGQVAWTETSNWADNQDLYLIKEDPAKEGHYLFDGRSYPFKVRTETLRLRQPKGGYLEETITVRETHHGVLVNDLVPRLAEDFPLVALRRVIGHPIQGMEDLYRSETVHDVKHALREMSAFQGHWVFGDTEGNIGYFGACALPVRLRHKGTFPVPGWTSMYDWTGLYPVDHLPSIINPPTGYVATANSQTVDPGKFPVPINYEGDISARTSRILARLQELQDEDGNTVDAMLQLQDDGYEIVWEWLKPELTPLLTRMQESGEPLVAAAARELRLWDGMNETGAIGPTLFHGLFAEACEAALDDEVPPATMKFLLDFFNAEPLYYSILKEEENIAWDRRSTDEVETRSAIMEEAFTNLVAKLQERYGDDMTEWRWGNVCTLTFKHPFGGKKKALAKQFNRGPYEVAGSPNSVFKSQFSRVDSTKFDVLYGPTFRIAVDMGDLSTGKYVIPGGQSGRAASRHYDDLIPYFLAGDGVPIVLNTEAAQRNSRVRMRIRPE